MKKEIASAVVLAYYKPKKQTVLQTDASTKGLGACLLQDEKPVYFASKALNYALKGYVNIELESLAVAKAKKIRTFPCHFTVQYIPGMTIQLADCLSHLGGQKNTIKLPKLHLYQIINQLCARSDSLNQIRISALEDDELALLKHTITQGWLSTIRKVPNVLQPYWTFREEFMVEDGIVLKGTQIVIPSKKP